MKTHARNMGRFYAAALDTNEIKKKWIRLPYEKQERKRLVFPCPAFRGGLFPPEKERNMRDKSKGNPRALLPIGVFLVIFLGAGILSGDFYTMPAIVGFLIALTVAFCQNQHAI